MLSDNDVLKLLRQYIADYQANPNNPPSGKSFTGAGTGLSVKPTWISDVTSRKYHARAFDMLQPEEKLFFRALKDLRTPGSSKQAPYSTVQAKITELKNSSQEEKKPEDLQRSRGGTFPAAQAQAQPRDAGFTPAPGASFGGTQSRQAHPYAPPSPADVSAHSRASAAATSIEPSRQREGSDFATGRWPDRRIEAASESQRLSDEQFFRWSAASHDERLEQGRRISQRVAAVSRGPLPADDEKFFLWSAASHDERQVHDRRTSQGTAAGPAAPSAAGQEAPQRRR